MAIHLGGRGFGHAVRTLLAAPAAALSALSSVNKGPGVTLSGSDLIMDVSTAYSQAALGTIAISGKKCFGATPTTDNGGCVFGIANISQNLNSYPGDDYANSIGYQWNAGNVLMGAGSSFIAVSAADTENLCAIDTTLGKVWFNINGTWDGDPVAGTGGYDLPSGGGPFYPCVARPTGGTFVYDPDPAGKPIGFSAV